MSFAPSTSDTAAHPQSHETLNEVEESSNVSMDAFGKQAGACESRPAFLTEMGQNRLHITEGKRAEPAVREAEVNYRFLFENAGEGIFQTAKDGRLLTANRALARVYGYDSPEHMIHSVGDMWRQCHADLQQRKKLRRELDEFGSVRGFEAEHYRRDGSQIWVTINARAVYDGSGQLIYYEGAVQDITERKQAEQELRLLSGRVLHLQDEERRRIARELHDTTGQQLAALVMQLGALRESGGNLSRKIRTTLSECLALAKHCARDVRTVSYLLHPPELDHLGLVPAVRAYVEGFRRRSGTRVVLNVPAELSRLPEEVETALFRIVQESLANVHHHSGSSRAEIRMSRDAGKLTLEVEDEGRGMPAVTQQVVQRGAASLGLGILGMRERMKQLGGQLKISSGVRGTRVTATLPLAQVTINNELGSHSDR